MCCAKLPLFTNIVAKLVKELESFRQNLELKVESKETENQEAMRQVSILKDELLVMLMTWYGET